MGDTTVLNKLWFEPILMPGRAVRLEPINVYGYYVVPRKNSIEVLPPVTVNVATPWSAQLAAFSTTGNQTPVSRQVDDLDMQPLNLGHYRLVAIDNVLFQINQPAGAGKFVNKDGPVRFGIETQRFFEQGMWSMLPELFVFGDNETRPTLNAVNATFRATYYARFRAFGFRYILQKLKNEPNTPYLTIRLENDQ